MTDRGCNADARLAFFLAAQVAEWSADGERPEEQLGKINLAGLPASRSADGEDAARAVFPAGVCDWTKPGVGQQDPVSPMTFSAGPGGVALPTAPVSTPI